jgi:hypothetical protein
MYTVTTKDQTGREAVSRYFDTKRAATTWFRWLLTQTFATEVALYRGQAGPELISRESCR